MACTAMRHWTRLLTLLSLTRIATVQYAVPMFAAPPVLPVMLPALALGPPQPRAPPTTTTTTTTTERSVAVAVPVGVPMAVPFPLPVYAQPDFCRAEPRPTACPACPPCHCTPSCTPAFFSFCSPCHQRCRCRSPHEAPVPMPPSPPVALAMHSYPVPLPAPAPLVVVPLPPLRVVKPKTKRKPRRYSSSETSRTSGEDWSEFSSDDGLSSSDSDYFYKKIRRKKKSHKKRRRYPSRRNSARAGDGEVVKPVLTYVSQNGNIKFKTKISNAQAARLLGARRAPASSERSPAVETVQVVAHEEPAHRPRVVVVSKVEQKVREPQPGAGAGPRRIELREGARPPHDLRPGKKEIVFRPPSNKRISNLSVSFQVSE